MEALSSAALAEKAGISTGLAKTLLKMPGAPDPAKFNTEASYLRRLARAAIAAGHRQASLQALTMKPSGGRPEASPPPTDESHTPERAREPSDGSAVDMDDLQESATVLRGVVKALGESLSGYLKAGDAASALPLLDKFKGLQAEFRQTAQRLEELRAERLLVLPRAEVYAAAGQMFQTVRAFADALATDLLDNGALPAWVAGAGGVFPDSRQAMEFVRAEVRAFCAKRYIAMADALGNLACPAEGAPPELKAECCLAMAAELEKTAAKLREQAVKAGAGA